MLAPLTFHSPARRRGLSAGVAALALIALPAWPADGPRPLRIVVPFPAGGTLDLLLRRLAEPLSATLQLPVIVDNRPGASGVLAARIVAQAPADGGTLLYLHSGLVTVQAMTGQLDLLNMFQPVARIHSSPYVLTLRGGLPYRSQAELFAAVQAQPGRFSFGSGGNGSPAHLLLALLAERVPGGLPLTHVPYKGGVEYVRGLLAGEVDVCFALPGAVAEQVKTGRLRLLSVTGPTRLAQFPDLPTVAEAGVPGFHAEPWGGFAAPAGTPAALVARLAAALRLAAEDPGVVALLHDQGGRLDVSASPAEFSAALRGQIEVDRSVVKRLGLSNN
ncbi:tripartite tricarboxylate transporter substrate binding protein [Hydrogenophaga sp.]|uniref:Bug family tripartite tricarboxylate transporter substrate binding protein n=1 Tax=Hydrogenophaga sp. TaxID=1904254 RepID=UPI00286D9F87|nr:tripartite tricarboxylate transporter substrate binding protein [Hydrogenophaga sp.]